MLIQAYKIAHRNTQPDRKPQAETGHYFYLNLVNLFVHYSTEFILLPSFVICTLLLIGALYMCVKIG